MSSFEWDQLCWDTLSTADPLQWETQVLSVVLQDPAPAAYEFQGLNSARQMPSG